MAREEGMDLRTAQPCTSTCCGGVVLCCGVVVLWC